MKRGLGMFVKTGARDLFVEGRTSEISRGRMAQGRGKIQRLGLTQKELDAAAAKSKARKEKALRRWQR